MRPVGRGEQDVDMIEDNHCQGPKPRETKPCEAVRRRRDGKNDSKRRHHVLSASAHSSTLSRQSNFIKAAGESTKTALNGDDDDVEDRRTNCRLLSIGDPLDPSRSPNNGNVNALPGVTVSLIPPDGSTRDSCEIHPGKRSQMDKRSDDGNDHRPNDRQAGRTDKIKKGELVIDKEDTRNLTLTIILERDENNAVVNFPRDFQPQPPGNGTEFTLIGMDALRYVQRIQEETRAQH